MSTAAGFPSFDPDTYIQHIVEAFRRAADGDLPPLLERYALDRRFADASDSQIIGWRDKVVDLWRRQAETSTGLGRDCQRLLQADSELRSDGSYENPQWWRAKIGAPRSAGLGSASASANVTNGQPTTGARSAVGEQPQPASSASAERPDPQVELPRPTGLEAETSDDGVMLRWQEPAGMPAGVTFAVERLVGSRIKRIRPASRLGAEDREPPAGTPLTYRVVAEHAESGSRSDSQPVEVWFVPPVTNLAARQTREGGVLGQWSAHADLWEVRVRRTTEGLSTDQAEGAPIQTRGNGFDDLEPPAGHHTYSVLPLYQDPVSGQVREGRPTSVKVSVLPPPPPPRLTWQQGEGRGSAVITLQWSKLPAETTLLLRRAAVEPARSLEGLLMLEEAEAMGEPVAEGLTGTTALVELPAGRWALVPFAVAGERAMRGDSINIEVAPQVSSLEVTRTGPEVFVSWVWPSGVRLARVTWRANGIDSSQEVTYNQYQQKGGVLFRRSEAATVEVSSVVRSGGSDVLECAPATVGVPPQPPTLTYQIHGVRRFFGLLPWRGRRRVVLVTDVPCSFVRVEIYIHIPEAPESDRILHFMTNVDLGPGNPHEVTVALPTVAARDRPYYISCRAWTAAGPGRVDDLGSGGREVR